MWQMSVSLSYFIDYFNSQALLNFNTDFVIIMHFVNMLNVLVWFSCYLLPIKRCILEILTTHTPAAPVSIAIKLWNTLTWSMHQPYALFYGQEKIRQAYFVEQDDEM